MKERTRVKKNSEPPWITPYIRKLIKKRRAIFRKFGRNKVWKAVKRRTKKERTIITSRRKRRYNKAKTITSTNVSKLSTIMTKVRTGPPENYIQTLTNLKLQKN